MQEALNQKIDAFVAANKEQILKDIATLVSINSVEGTPEEGAPYGAGPRAALDKTLELAAGMGLATRNCENHIGYAELAGADAEKYLATICHVDVVPEGNGWTEDPFKMEIRDGWMIGRGVADDKGPMVATLYALKFLKEEGVSLRYPIRALVGDNEETLADCSSIIPQGGGLVKRFFKKNMTFFEKAAAGNKKRPIPGRFDRANITCGCGGARSGRRGRLRPE